MKKKRYSRNIDANDRESWRRSYLMLWHWGLFGKEDLEALFTVANIDHPTDSELRRNKGDCVFLIQFLLYQLLESDHLISDLPGGVRGHA